MASETEVAGFRGTDRFEVRRWLGAGAFGVVYEAYDRERDARVALKTIGHLNPASIYRFKQEFRALADVTHPNLVRLHELVSAGDGWFFTMEVVEGANFHDYVRVPARAGAPDESRLRAALRQLAEGLVALHDAGKLHRDVKPSNVLVNESGRVVLLDFGLVMEIGQSRLDPTSSRGIAGTASYMSPEQAADLPLTAATDWYSVGVVLYQALTGELPFRGTPAQVLAAKQRDDPPPPRALAPACPADLDALCTELLQRRPYRRPSGPDILRRLGGAPPAATTPPPAGSSSGAVRAPAAPLVGREPQLAALAEAFEASRRTRPVTVYVHGASGMGKTALVRSFLEGLLARDDAVCLAGRCYERESVPYKAFDSLVDSLSRHLLSLPRYEADLLMPRDIHALARLFPVLPRVEAVAEAPHRGLEALDPQKLRRRAFAALRDLLGRLSDRKPLVLFIDDLQWGDADSGALLAELLRPPDPPALLLIACYRSEEAEASPLLAALRSPRSAAEAAAADVREVIVGPLSPAEARDLALARLGGDGAAAASVAVAETVARESGGSPFFVGELARYVDAAGETAAAGTSVTLEEVLRARIARLPPGARRLLEAAAVAGRPVALEVARRAVDLGDEERTAVAVLKSESLVRTRGTFDEETIETLHDRIRESVIAALPEAASKERHRRLARALEAAGRADPEALASHFRAAGELALAGEYAARAAAQASQALAFDNAARLYRLALELRPPDAGARRELWLKLGDALANGGRGREAAGAYLEAVAGASPAEALELRLHAAEQLMRSGYVDEGIAPIHAVLEAVNMRLPATRVEVLARLFFGRLYARLRGLRFRERDASEVPPGDLMRIDTCWSVTSGLAMIDPLRGAEFATRHLRLALRAGEPFRVARALAAEGAYLGMEGGASIARTGRVLAAGQAIASRLGHPYLLGYAATTAGAVACMQGRYRDGEHLCEGAVEIFQHRSSGMAWEAGTAQVWLSTALFYLGKLGKLAGLLPHVIAEAEDRGDLYTVTSLRTGLANSVWLAADDPVAARAEQDHAMRRWTPRGFHVQNYYAMTSRAQADLYRGDAAAALAEIEKQWPALDGLLLLKVQYVRVEATHLRARAALAVAESEGREGEREALLRAVERTARALERETGAPWSAALATLLRAGVAARRGDARRAAELCAAAAEALASADLALYAAAARRRRGEIVGGDEGRALVAGADAWMAGQGVRNPGRLTAVLAPGFNDQ